MPRRALVLHGFMAMLLTSIFLTFWGGLILAGEGPWFSWNRSFGFLGTYTDMYAMALITVVIVPGIIVTVWHTLVLLGRAEYRPGIAAMSNLIAGLTIAILSVVVVRFKLWEDVFASSTAHAFPTPPPDTELKFPDLPLKPKDALAWEMQATDGKTIKLANLKGKVVFLNFWATWCGFCKAEFPNVQRLYDSVKDNPNIAVVLVTEEKPEDVKKWLASDEGKPYKLPFYITKEIPEDYAPSGWPTTYILAPDGRIAFRHSGFAGWDGGKTKEFIEKLAAK